MYKLEGSKGRTNDNLENSISNLYSMEESDIPGGEIQNELKNPDRLTRYKNKMINFGKGIIDFYKDGWKWKIPATLVITIPWAVYAGIDGINHILPLGTHNSEKLYEVTFKHIPYLANHVFSHLTYHLNNFLHFGKAVLPDAPQYGLEGLDIGGIVSTKNPGLAVLKNYLFNAASTNAVTYTIASGINYIKNKLKR